MNFNITILTVDGRRAQVRMCLALQAEHIRELIEDKGSIEDLEIPLGDENCTYEVVQLILRQLSDPSLSIINYLDNSLILRLIRASVFLQVPALLRKLAQIPRVLLTVLDDRDCCKDIVRELIDYKADVNAEDGGQSVLSKACLLQSDEVVQEVQRGLMLAQGWTQLMIEADKEKSERMIELISNENANAKNKDNRTALHYACLKGNEQAVALLLDARCDVNVKDKKGVCSLHLACVGGYVEVVKSLVLAKSNLNFGEERGGFSALHLTATFDIVKILIDAQADVNSKSHEGMTPLHYASNADVARIMIDAKADIHAGKWNMEGGGKSPLHCARSAEIVRLLVQARADVNATACFDRDSMPLHYASREGNTQVVQALLIARGNVDARTGDFRDMTALHLATLNGHEEAVRVLLRAGADVDARMRWGDTPLHCACHKGHASIVQALVDCRAYVNATKWVPCRTHQQGETPLYLAAGEGSVGAVKALIAARANVNALSRGDSPLNHALSLGHSEVVASLLEAKAGLPAEESPLPRCCGIPCHSSSGSESHRDSPAASRESSPNGLSAQLRRRMRLVGGL